MFVTIKRKYVTVVSIVVLFVIAGVLSIGTSDKEKSATHVATDSYQSETDTAESGEAVLVSAEQNLILKAKNDREVVRSKACELLSNTLKNSDASQEAKSEAEQKLMEMAEDMDNEIECESIIAAKGFGDCVVFISENGVNVTVNKKDMTAEDVAKINDIIFEITGKNNIKIVEVK